MNRPVAYQFVWLVLFLSAVLYLVFHLKVVTNLAQFLPSAPSAMQTDRPVGMLSELQKLADTNLVLLQIMPGDPEQAARLSVELKNRLLVTGMFRRVLNGEEMNDVEQPGQVFAARYLLSPAVDRDKFTVNGLQTALRARLDEIRMGMGILLKRTLAADPQNFFLAYLQNAFPAAGPPLQHGVWFSRDSKSALLLLTIEANGYDLNRQAQALSQLRGQLAVLGLVDGVGYRLSGPAVFAVASRQAIKQASLRISVVAGGLTLLLFLAVYRVPRFIGIVVVPLLSAIVVAMAVTQALFGEVHGITMVFGVTLLGVCLDYPIHLFSHLRGESPYRTVKAIWPTLRLGVVTTALAYLALLGTDFTGLSQIAVFAISGLFSSAAVTRWILPYWLPRRERIQRLGFIRPVLRLAESGGFRQAGYAIAVAIVIGAALFLPGRTIWEGDIAALSPVPGRILETDRLLRSELGLAEHNHLFVIRAASRETALIRCERLVASLAELVAAKVIGGVEAACQILPSERTQQGRQRQLPPGPILAQRLSEALQDMPFKAGLFAPFLADVEASRQRPLVTEKDFVDSPWTEALSQRLLGSEQNWTVVIRLVGVRDTLGLQRWLAAHDDERAAYFNLRETTSRLLSDYRNQALARLVWASPIALLVILLVSRSVRRTLQVSLPVGFGLLATVLLLVVIGQRLNLFHLLSLLLVAGIGIDYSLFFARHGAVPEERLQTMHGVVISALTTLAAFGVMAFSGIAVLRAMGLTIAIGVLCCLLLSVLLVSGGSSGR